MSQRSIAIGLKIPDNEAYTALIALQSLGIAVARVERTVIVVLDDGGDARAMLARVERNPSRFNPNKHRATLLDGNQPRAGETWIEEIGPSGGEERYVGWRLFDAAGLPASRAVVAAAATVLLCNPAVESAILPNESTV